MVKESGSAFEVILCLLAAFGGGYYLGGKDKIEAHPAIRQWAQMRDLPIERAADHLLRAALRRVNEPRETTKTQLGVALQTGNMNYVLRCGEELGHDECRLDGKPRE